ncbi:MAG TPA: ABC transporter ATP-binding protein [Anaerolineales bacterium]|nr:ABC transporter ATP-binding protein [Anaerolineales bacterium]
MTLTAHGYQDDNLNLLIRYLKPQWPKALLLSLLLFISIGLQLAAPIVLGNFVDGVMAARGIQALSRMALLFLGIALIQQVFVVSATYLSEDIGWVTTNQLRQDLAYHCLRLDMPFFHQHTPGELIERIDGDVDKLANFFSRFTIQILGNALLMAGILVVLSFQNFWIGVSLAVFVVLTLLVLHAIRNLAVPSWELARQASASLLGFLEERVSGAEDIRALGAKEYILYSLHPFFHQLLRRSQKANVMSAATVGVTLVAFTLGNVLGLFLGAYFFFRGMVTVGTIYMIYYFTELIRTPLRDISNEIQDLQQAGGSIRRIQELLRMRSSIQEGVQHPLPPGPLSISFQDVTFAYQGETNVLERISFEIGAGKVLGLLGRTGSGKSTIARLLLKMYDPYSGAIWFNGMDLRSTSLAETRRAVGLVTQDVQILQGISVRDNLTFFDRSISDDQIVEVFEHLGLDQWYQSLPHGLDTVMESGEKGISAGQAQVLAFARVFLKDPGIVILDEASSRLDPFTERLIMEATERLLEDRTAVIIAHRLETVDRVDQILILENGKILEQGANRDLRQDPASHFSRLLQTGLGDILS